MSRASPAVTALGTWESLDAASSRSTSTSSNPDARRGASHPWCLRRCSGGAIVAVRNASFFVGPREGIDGAGAKEERKVATKPPPDTERQRKKPLFESLSYGNPSDERCVPTRRATAAMLDARLC